jgi:hypothetical protein
MTTRIIELIITDSFRGSGTETDQARNAVQLWTKDGILIAEYDPPASDSASSTSWFHGEIARGL